MKPIKTQNNYDVPIGLTGLPIFVYEEAQSSYKDKSPFWDSSLWQSYDDSGKVSPREIESTLLEKPTMDIEHIVLSFKQAIEHLRSDALELMYVAKQEDDYVEIWIYGNQIPEYIRDSVYRIDFDFGGRFPNTIGDIHVSDRRGRPMSKHATFDLATEDSYALYRLSSNLWRLNQNTQSNGKAIMISLRS